MSEEREVRTGTCVCGTEFEIPAKRGRPPVRCLACREAYSNGTLPDRLVSLGIDPHVALRKPNKSGATRTPKTKINEPEIGSEIEIPEPAISVNERLDRLEMLLKSRGLHISQHRDKW